MKIFKVDNMKSVLWWICLCTEWCFCLLFWQLRVLTQPCPSALQFWVLVAHHLVPITKWTLQRQTEMCARLFSCAEQSQEKEVGWVTCDGVPRHRLIYLTKILFNTRIQDNNYHSEPDDNIRSRHSVLGCMVVTKGRPECLSIEKDI